jgi:UDP-N-acetylmuramoyl-L-alanyl-D-glutamate--2,6-diaminopimelate ligase
MANYWQAKARLFAWPGLKAAVVNVDDPQGAQLACELACGALALWTVSLHGEARLRASALRYVDGGLAFEVHEAGQVLALQTELIGDHSRPSL